MLFYVTITMDAPSDNNWPRYKTYANGWDTRYPNQIPYTQIPEVTEVPTIDTIHVVTDADASDAVLCVIDMQNDFTTGSFKVQNNEEGVTALVDVLRLPWKCVVASKDFHPPDHMSFKTTEVVDADNNKKAEKGRFPPHCVQHKFEQKDYSLRKVHDEKNAIDTLPGYVPEARGGAKFDERVLEALNKQKNVHVFFKAFFKHVDSFGASAYTGDTMISREGMLTHGAGQLGFEEVEPDLYSCIDAFTGSWEFPLEDEGDIDSDPKGYDELFASACVKTVGIDDYIIGQKLEDTPRLDGFIRNQVKSASGGRLNVFVCGLALDFCVQDTAVNIKARFRRDVNVFVIMDASTPVSHYDPKKLTDQGINLATINVWPDMQALAEARGWPRPQHPLVEASAAAKAVAEAKKVAKPRKKPKLAGMTDRELKAYNNHIQTVRKGWLMRGAVSVGGGGDDDRSSAWPWIVQGAIVSLVCALAGSFR